MINKETKIYGSFSRQAGNVGCRLFNTSFKFYRLNCIYRSFSVDDIESAVSAARCLGFSGFAVSMPFKKQILEHVDSHSPEVLEIGSANTVNVEDGFLKCYNTDYKAVKEMLESYKKRDLVILGNGGYAAAIKYAAKQLGYTYEVVTRKSWSEISQIRDKIIFNATPVKDLHHTVDMLSNDFIDCDTDSRTGRILAKTQAAAQFRIYTNLDFPLRRY
jgi:shikimate dehydrogenase